jgi:hypothetical protein
MQDLQIGNDQVHIRVSRDGTLAFRLAEDEQFGEGLPLREGTIGPGDVAPVAGVLHYAAACLHESVSIHMEGTASPILRRAAGEWPTEVDDEHLEAYPHLHFLEERKTGIPWRLERWYSLAGPYLIFDSHQYFERGRPRQRGRDWERIIVELRQVLDLRQRGRHSATASLIRDTTS